MFACTIPKHWMTFAPSFVGIQFICNPRFGGRPQSASEILGGIPNGQHQATLVVTGLCKEPILSTVSTIDQVQTISLNQYQLSSIIADKGKNKNNC